MDARMRDRTVAGIIGHGAHRRISLQKGDSMMFANPAVTPGEGRAGKPKRPTWHWLVIGGLLAAAALLVLVVGSVLLIMILARGNPQDTLDSFYESMRTGDCELFMESTSETFRDSTGLTSCSVFEENLAGIDIDYDVNKRVNRSGYAVFGVTEHYQHPELGPVDVDMEFYIARRDGGWQMDGVLEASEDSITSGD